MMFGHIEYMPVMFSMQAWYQWYVVPAEPSRYLESFPTMQTEQLPREVTGELLKSRGQSSRTTNKVLASGASKSPVFD